MSNPSKSAADLAAEKAVVEYKRAWKAAMKVDPTGKTAYGDAARAAIPAYNEFVAAKKAERDAEGA